MSSDVSDNKDPSTTEGSNSSSAASDVILTVGLEAQSQYFQQGNENFQKNELWLVIAPADKKGSWVGRQRAALVSSTKKRDELITSHFQNGNGYTTMRITNMEELRDALVDLLPQPEKEHTGRTNLSSFYDDFPDGLDEVKRFELFRGVIEHEDNLLNERVSWLLLAQSFLMAAFLSSSGTASNGLRYVAPAVGLATVVGTMPAVVAAGRNIELQQQVYFQFLRSDERCKQLHGHTRDPSVYEKDEHRERKAHGHIFPNMAFRGKTAVKILHTVVAIAAAQFIGWIFLLAAVIADW